jgi:hypothetical protein
MKALAIHVDIPLPPLLLVTGCWQQFSAAM